MRLRDDDAGFGIRVRILRAKHKLSQQQVADVCGVSRTSIANIEGGRQLPTMATLRELAKALGTTAGVLVGLEPMPDESRLPEVRVVVLYRVECEVCGEVETLTDPLEAGEARRKHHVPHPSPDSS